ncbi:hypothetical protein BDP55DRAFT_628247 [Colletotrichum godetiae]|uniref:Uncharacterized protein n=1 Tax=Colletotrichum godetiae TaxID=1209918 RepID=A0AAJ0AVD4_9PEZI|nr:uncharacterized protein BDP55DRAFT_628247 [Colletotrichum godetiae]KAK1689686.1 hypothetical protein BDP55DRAFT_628247 [Colletotrichum godetiae]
MLVRTLTDREDSEESTQLLDKPKEVLLAGIMRFLKHPDIKYEHIVTLQDAVTPFKMSYLDDIDARLEVLTHTLQYLDTDMRKNPLKYGGIDLRVVSKLTWALIMIASMNYVRDLHDEAEESIGDEENEEDANHWVLDWNDTCHIVYLEVIRIWELLKLVPTS